MQLVTGNAGLGKPMLNYALQVADRVTPVCAATLLLIHSPSGSASLKASLCVRTVGDPFYKEAQNNRELAKFNE